MAKKTKYGWGGARPGSGRPKDPNSGAPHTPRPAVSPNQMVAVQLRVNTDLKKVAATNALFSAMSGGSSEERGFRVLRYALEGREILVVVKARDTVSLSLGMQGLGVRISRQVNRAMGRRGKLFEDRFMIVKRPRALSRWVRPRA